jgi:hypothetical protein
MDPPRHPRTRARRPPLLLLAVAGLVLAGLVGLVWYVGPSRGEDFAGGAVTTGPDAAAGGTGATGPTRAAPSDSGAGRSGPAEGGPGPGGTTGAPPPAAPACERVLSAGEAAAALGRPVARVQARDGFLVRACLFWDRGNDRYLLVQLQQGPTASETAFRLSRRPVDKPVAGIGGAARWEPDTGLLDVLDGATRFQVGVFDTGGLTEVAEPPAGVRAVARAVAARL